MTNPISNHLNEEQLIEAVIDEAGLDSGVRSHLFACSSCRAEKELLEGKLTRFGQRAQEHIPKPHRRPRLGDEERTGAFFGSAWRIRPTFGMSLALASVLVLLLAPLAYRHERTVRQERVYQEMLQDEKFMTEIEKLEENPLPRFYVDISESSDPDGHDESTQRKLPAVQDGKLS